MHKTSWATRRPDLDLRERERGAWCVLGVVISDVHVEVRLGQRGGRGALGRGVHLGRGRGVAFTSTWRWPTCRTCRWPSSRTWRWGWRGELGLAFISDVASPSSPPWAWRWPPSRTCPSDVALLACCGLPVALAALCCCALGRRALLCCALLALLAACCFAGAAFHPPDPGVWGVAGWLMKLSDLDF